MKLSALYLLIVVTALAQGPTSYADAIIPQVPSGCGWTFSIVLVNLAPRPVAFRLNFWKPYGIGPGNPTAPIREIPLKGFGTVNLVKNTIPPGGSITIASEERAADAPDCDGWAELNSEEPVGGYVTFNQRSTIKSEQMIGGIRVQQEADFSVDTTVPFASRFASRFVVPFETGSYVNTLAVVNPSFQTPADVRVTYRRENGEHICDEVRQFRPGEQQTWVLAPPADEVTSVCGYPSYQALRDSVRGVIEFYTPNLELSGVGLRFGNLGFVAYPGQTPIGR